MQANRLREFRTRARISLDELAGSPYQMPGIICTLQFAPGFVKFEACLSKLKSIMIENLNRKES